MQDINNILPEEIINEIICCVPLIDLFRVSRVCHLFKKLAYQRRTSITDEKEYQKAAEKGNILSLMNCSLSYDNNNNGLFASCRGSRNAPHSLANRETGEAHASLEIVQYMMSKGATNWNWGLRGACRGGHMEIVRLMISKGANDWNRGLFGACYRGHMNIVQFMIEKRAKDWNLGLYGACRGGHMNIVHLMIKKGATHWNWGLSRACKGGHIEIIELMIEKGATECYCSKSIEEHIYYS